MNFRFRTHRETAALPAACTSRPAHAMSSDFDAGLCRFVLVCSCGAEFDTPYIDEALELREMHELLAPLSDQLTS